MKKIVALISIVTAMIITPAYALDVSQRWDTTYNIGEFAMSIACDFQQTSDGGYILAGSTDLFGSALVMKLNYNGDIIWQKKYPLVHLGGGGAGLSIQQTSDGGYIVGGWTEIGMLALKLDNNGTITWQKVYQGYEGIYGVSIRQTQDGGFVMTGGSSDFGGSLLVVKLSPDGDMSWYKMYYPFAISTFSEAKYPILQTSDGGYVVTGGEGMVVLKLDSNGNILWQKKYPEGRFPTAIVMTSDGEFILSGAGGTLNEMLLIKIDSGGNTIWQKNYLGEGILEYFLFSIVQTSDGGYVGAGRSDYDETNHLWIVKFDGNGDISWQKEYLQRNSGMFPTISTTSDGGYAVASASSIPPTYDWKVWVLKLDSNGEIPDCAVLSTADAVAIETAVSVEEGTMSFSSFSLYDYDPNIIPLAVSSDVSAICQYDDPLDSDGDGVESNPGGMMAGSMQSSSFLANGDNCSGMPNGPYLGTCTEGNVGSTCIADAACGVNGFCSMAQEDTYPPQGNDIGDACDCEGNFDCNTTVDGMDAATFKVDYGRSSINRPCTNTVPCNGDFSCNGTVDGLDAALFKSDFGRSGINNPCPNYVTDPWCVY